MIDEAIKQAVIAVLSRGRIGRETRRRLERGLRRQQAMRRAAASFPNNLGNYQGKRTARPMGRPLSPAERFRRLAGCYLAARMTYRNPRKLTHA